MGLCSQHVDCGGASSCPCGGFDMVPPCPGFCTLAGLPGDTMLTCSSVLHPGKKKLEEARDYMGKENRINIISLYYFFSESSLGASRFCYKISISTHSTARVSTQSQNHLVRNCIFVSAFCICIKTGKRVIKFFL